MLITALDVSQFIIQHEEQKIQDQILLNKLISISDYVVRYSSVEKNSEYYIPNKVSSNSLSQLDLNILKEKMNLEALYIDFYQGTGFCIYRLVIHDEKIKKLYFCGD